MNQTVNRKAIEKKLTPYAYDVFMIASGVYNKTNIVYILTYVRHVPNI